MFYAINDERIRNCFSVDHSMKCANARAFTCILVHTLSPHTKSKKKKNREEITYRRKDFFQFDCAHIRSRARKLCNAFDCELHKSLSSRSQKKKSFCFFSPNFESGEKVFDLCSKMYSKIICI